MKNDIVATIEKLLRVAQGKGNEAKVAHERAEALMQKHNINVSLSRSDERRVVVPGVRGIYWREQLLTVIASVTGARALRNPRDRTSILAGSPSSISVAKEMYEYVSLQIMLLANDRWLLFVLGSGNLVREEEARTPEDLLAALMGSRLDGTDDDDDGWSEIEGLVGVAGEMRNRPSNPPRNVRSRRRDFTEDAKLEAVAPLWQRAFCTIVVGDVAKKLTRVKTKKKRSPKYEPPPPDVRSQIGLKTEAEEQKAELAIFEAEIKKLAPIVGDKFARATVRDAVQNGGYSAGRISFTWRTRKLLTAASSFLPPPPPPPEPVKPTRFNQLDVDWE